MGLVRSAARGAACAFMAFSLAQAMQYLVAGASEASSATFASHTTALRPHDGSAWLDEVNMYRLAAGESPVSDNPAWDLGLDHHFTYLENTSPSLMTGPYASAHTENPASPYYTADGEREGSSSDLALGDGSASSVELIDDWFEAPFHAVGMLRPALTQVAFASDGIDAGIDVISGLGSGQPLTSPVLFPGPGVTTNLLNYGGELPDPLETCGWQGQAVGLPLIALLPQSPSVGLAATLQSTAGSSESTSAGNLCVVDTNDYHSSDTVYGPTGAGILAGDNAVFLIPKAPLVTARYTATITQPGQPDVSWSFSAQAPPTAPAPVEGGPGADGRTVGMAASPDGSGYWIAHADGEVTPHGTAGYYGSMMGRPLNAPISHIVATPDGRGYWLVAADGGTFTFGDAGFFGSMGGRHLNAPIVDIAPTADGKGYWLVASDGGVFTFGDARFFGSMGGRPLNRPIVGITGDRVTGGYRLVASDGGIFAFNASFLGSTGNLELNAPVIGMATSADGGGYWFVASDGGLFAYGDARFAGAMGGSPLNVPIVGMAVDEGTGGYWLVSGDGGVFAYHAPFLGTG